MELSRNNHSAELSVSDKQRYMEKTNLLVTFTCLGFQHLAKTAYHSYHTCCQQIHISVQLSGADKFLHTGST